MELTVTSYPQPDLDGVACMYAYAEYLNKIGKKANYVVDGIPKKEVSIVCDLFDIHLEKEKKIYSNFVVVDTNTLRDMPDFVKKQQIVEIIDHHIVNNDVKEFTNAKIQIEMLGAAATLVAEKFQKQNISISRNSAILLYYGIISNSINLKARNCTEKDREMASWLQKQCVEIKEEYIEKIFKEKSKIEDNHLREEMEAEYVLQIGNDKVIIAQLEIVNADVFLLENQTKIDNILNEIKKEKMLDYIFLNCIDILNGYCIIYIIDGGTNEWLSEKLHIIFDDNQSKIEPILMRKEIIKMLKNL